MSKKNKKLKEHYTTKRASSVELKNREEIIQKFLKSPVPKNEILENLGLFLTTKNFSRMLFFNISVQASYLL